ncbi:hypothetical protein U9M48_015773, partial [Paspalum notatum var. saurae]
RFEISVTFRTSNPDRPALASATSSSNGTNSMDVHRLNHVYSAMPRINIHVVFEAPLQIPLNGIIFVVATLYEIRVTEE